EMLVRRREMRAWDRRAQALPRRGRRAARGPFRHAAVEAAAGARLDLACGGFVSLSRADARSPGDANGLLPPHRIRVRGRGVMARSREDMRFTAKRALKTLCRGADAVAQAGDAGHLGAMLAAEESPFLLEPVAHDADAAIVALRRQRMDRTFE